jgi:hypothetical protein
MFDPGCYELAEKFMAGEPKTCRTELNTAALAQHIQNSVEAWIEDFRQRRMLVRFQRCPDCGQPMLPKGVTKKPNQYDHARGCPREARP